MNRALKMAFLCIGGGVSALSLAGCKASACPDTMGPDGGTVTHDNCVQLEPLTQFKDDRDRTASMAWSTGKNITINNANGRNVNGDGSRVVADGPADQVSLTARGFRFEVEADKQKATDFLTTFANPTIESDANGNLIVTGPGEGGNTDGYILTVHIPATFDAALIVNQAEGLDLGVNGAATAKSTTITNGLGGITAKNLTGTINISSQNGDLTVSATPSGPGNILHTDLGDINVSIGMANLKISATPEGGTATFPAAWGMPTLSADTKTSTVTIGDGSGALVATTGLGSIFFQ